jgi:hypothetical protein
MFRKPVTLFLQQGLQRFPQRFFSIPAMPPISQLSPFWTQYFSAADQAIRENFWGSLSTLKKAYQRQDAYALQLSDIGYRFAQGEEKPESFYQSSKWMLDKLKQAVQRGEIAEADVLLPGKAFEITEQDKKKIVFVCMGGTVPEGAKELNLLPPDIFVEMLSQGFFPIGAPIREHTNQTLCEHDAAHIAGFISCLPYMKAVRQAFREIGKKMAENPKIKTALANFDSLYSLRLYYMIEIFSIIPEANKPALEALLQLKIKDFSLDNPQAIYPKVIAFLKSKSPEALHEYLYRVYEGFPALVNPLGGESRDILNRTRKFSRSNQGGSFYAKMSNLDSKFDGSSIYSLFLNAKAALKNKRSNHPDYADSIRYIHAPVIASLLGTSQLTVEDWVFEAIAEVPNKDSKLYKYICETGLWNKSHVLYWAYSHPDCSKILKKSDFEVDTPATTPTPVIGFTSK